MAFRKGLNQLEPSELPSFDTIEPIQETLSSEVEDKRWLKAPKIDDDETLVKLNKQVDDLMATAYGTINDNITQFYNTMGGASDLDFSRLEPLSLERLILNIQQVVFLASDIVAELYNDAYWSDRTQQDEYWRAYKEPKSAKTKEDRQAYAMEQTKDTRFYYYARFMVWRRLSEKLTALKDLQRTLEFYRQRIQKDRFT